MVKGQIIVHLAASGTLTACGVPFLGGVAACHGVKFVTCLRCRRTRLYQRLREASTVKHYSKPNAVQQTLFAEMMKDER